MKLSIIIPFYNVEKYISKCLESLLKQLDKNDEVILINDGSSDNSLTICEKYEEKFNQIKIINIDRMGIADARNIGLKYAKGEYILWIDADDWVDDKYIFEIRKCIFEKNTDIILIDYCKVSDTCYNNVYYDTKSGFLERKNILLEVAQDSFRSLLWRTVARRNLYDNIIFPSKIQMMEDFSIYHYLIYNAKNYYYLHKNLYYYRILKKSLSHIKNQDIFSRYDIALKRELFYRKNYPEMEEKYRIVPVLIYACPILAKHELNHKVLGNISVLIKKNIIFLLSRKYISKKKKIQFILSILSPKLLKYIRKIYEFYC